MTTTSTPRAHYTSYKLRVTSDQGVTWEYLPGEYTRHGWGTDTEAQSAARAQCEELRRNGYRVEVCAHDAYRNG